MDPVQHAPRRVPAALRAKVQDALDNLEKQEITTPVTSPIVWISSIVTVPKKNGKLRICLDPRDLDRTLQREHYPLPTIKDIARRLHGAKILGTFSTDAENVDEVLFNRVGPGTRRSFTAGNINI